MRFNKKKLMEKRISELMAIIHIEGIEVIGLSETTKDSLSELILLMAGDVYPHSGPPPSTDAGPIPQAPNQDVDMGMSVRLLRIREQAEAAI